MSLMLLPDRSRENVLRLVQLAKEVKRDLAPMSFMALFRRFREKLRRFLRLDKGDRRCSADSGVS